jgi:hypothetical protein
VTVGVATGGANDVEAERLLKDVCTRRRSWKSGSDTTSFSSRPSEGVMMNRIWSGSWTPRSFNRIESTTE